MAETSCTIRTLAFAIAVSMLGNTASSWAQAAPPPPQTAPAQGAPPPAGASATQQGAPPANYPAQYPQAGQQASGSPPPAGFTPQQSPLVGQQQPGAQPQQGYAQPAYYGQQPGYAQQGRWQPPRRPRTRKGLMITGISILGGSYLLSAVIGAAALDDDYDEYDNYNDDFWDRDTARWLFVPVVGPFAAMSTSDEGDGLLVLLGMAQLVGTGLMVGGIIQYKNSKRAAEMEGYTHWKLPGNRALSLDVSASPRFAGPRMRLAF